MLTKDRICRTLGKVIYDLQEGLSDEEKMKIPEELIWTKLEEELQTDLKIIFSVLEGKTPSDSF